MEAELRQKLVHEFGISPPEADRLIARAQAKVHIKAAVAAAQQGVRAAPDPDFNDVNAWRSELRNRMVALEVLREGVTFVEKLLEQLKGVLEKERQLVDDKAKMVNDKGQDWWNFRESGWAAGGREMFAHLVHDILSNLDEAGLGSSVMKKLGFKRTVPMPDMQDMVPIETAEALEDSLVGGIKK